MKITLVSSTFPYPKAGLQVGIERHVHEYSLALLKKGHNVNVITTFWNGGKAEENYNGISLYRVTDSYHKFGKFGRQFDLPHLTFSWNILKYANILKTSDVVHAICPVYINKYLRKYHVPLVTHFHHLEKIRRLVEVLKYPFILRNQRKVYIHSDAIITMTRSGKQSLMTYYNLPARLIKIVPHGVDLDKFYEPPPKNHSSSQTKLLYVGGLEKRKGVRYLIEALNMVKQKGIRLRLILVGQGEQKKHLEGLVQQFGLYSEVEFVGFVDDTELLKQYKEADIFVFPSLQEGFGIPLIEAMACGLPIISTDTSSIPEVVGDAGILVEPKNAEKLAEAIVMLIENKLLYHELIERGQKRVEEKFSWDKVTGQLIKIYNQVILSKNPH